jgi:uncharacterized protein YPO0396
MTTFTTEDRIIAERDGSVTINVEPIPFAGLVQLQDKEDTEQMLRNQLSIVQAECQQLQAENNALKKTVDSLFAGLDSSLALNKAQAERQEK